MNWRRWAAVTIASAVSLLPSTGLYHAEPAQPDTAPCGYVDGFDLPVDDIDMRRTDFAIYRARFGGLHTGIDVAFEALGDPVRAAARGMVTYSDPEGWDTERGVVVVQHTMPDGAVVNTLYGHMEELNGNAFPPMGACVERGDIVGAIGFPSRGRPHLHYEIRTRYRHEGGPGYTDVSPLELGWMHPIDFTLLARAWVLPAYRSHFSLAENPSLAPVMLADGSFVTANNARLTGLGADGSVLWNFDTMGTVTALLPLYDSQVLAVTAQNQALVLQRGSYQVLWALGGPVLTPPLLLGGAVVFMREDTSLVAHTPEGALLWTTAPLGDVALRWAISGDRLAIATQAGALWVIDREGTVLLQQSPFVPAAVPFAGPADVFYVLANGIIYELDETLQATPLATPQLSVVPAEVELLRGPDGMTFLYTGEGRALYAYSADGEVAWIAFMPGVHLRAPRLGIGGGRALYALSMDGQLLVYDTRDGRLAAQVALYNGGVDGAASTRWLHVTPDDLVHFSSGYLSVISLAGLELLAG